MATRSLDVVTEAASHRLAPVSSLAIALIAFLAGADLRWSEVRERSRVIVRILTAEMGLTFVLMAGAVALLGSRLPFIQGTGVGELVAFSVQYHPESAAGPHDAAYLFDRFVDLLRSPSVPVTGPSGSPAGEDA